MSEIPLPDVDKDPSIGVSYNLQIGSGQSIVLQTFVPRDGEAKELNATLDKLRVAAERQWAFAERERLKMSLKSEEDMAAKQAMRIAQVDENIKASWSRSNKRGDPVLSAKERQEQAQAYNNAEECKNRVAAVKKSIADIEAIIGA